MGDYTSDDIEVLSGLDPVKKRPGMYTDTSTPNHIGQEVIDNSVDEAISGYADSIYVKLFTDNSLEVEDNGRGMPVDVHKTEKISGVELILTKLHSGGKFSNKNYTFSGGLHGVGISVVNALSSRVDVTVYRDGKVHEISFINSVSKEGLKVAGKCDKGKTGTKVRFWPDIKYFDTDVFAVNSLINLLQAKAVLCSNLKIEFSDEINNQDYSWCYKKGISHFLTENLKDNDLLFESAFDGSFSNENESLDWVALWSVGSSSLFCKSYVNLIPTAQGGTHVNGLKQGLLDAVRNFCNIKKLTPKNLKINSEDISFNCNYILSTKLKDPQFAGQTKEKLSSRKSFVFIAGVVADSFSSWLNSNTEEAMKLVDSVLAHAASRAKASKKIVRKRSFQGPSLPGKLTDCVSSDIDETELFLVEGDSAGGSAKQARNRNFQAIMPLKGKILNTWEVSPAKILDSQEVSDIAVAIGCDPDSDDISKLRYGKVCILADADSDGLHIATLLCALFVRHFPKLIENGHIYVAMPPLFRIDVGSRVFYALDEDEKNGILDRIEVEKIRGNPSVMRFKGLGEMSAMQLRETTMNPETRRLLQLFIDDEGETFKTMDMLLSKKRSSDRKNWLESKGSMISVEI